MSQYRILLVDDEQELVSTLVERLGFRGIEAEAVTNGHDAIELMNKEHFDVLVADLKMPGLSGPELIRHVRKRHPAVKIILITGHGGTQEGNPPEFNNVSEVLLKPFNINSLLDAIHRLMEKGDEN